MKTSRLLALVAVATAMLAGCSKERPIGGTDSPAEVRFTGNVASLVTRVSGTDGTQWDAGDPVGIYMFKADGTPFTLDGDLAANKRYTATAGTSATFTPADGVPLYYPADGSGVKFMAFHPQGGSITSDKELMFSVASQANLSAIDVLHSPLTAAYDRTATAPVPLVFAHKLTKLVFNVANGAGVTEPVSNGMTVAISGQKTTGELHLITGAIEVTGAATTLTATAAAGATKIEAIVIPSADLTDVTFTFTNAANQTFDVEVPTSAWEGGKRYTYTVTLKAADKRADITGTIDPWGDGGTEAVDGEEQVATPSGRIAMTLDPTGLTRAAGGTIAFGIAGNGPVNIAWGDGTANTVGGLSATSTQFTHTYAEGGSYNVSIEGSVTGLDCSRCGLSALDLTGAPTLASLDVSGNPLATFATGGKPIEALDLSGNTVISELSLDTSDIQSLDVSGCTALKTLNLSGRGLTTLDIDDCAALNYLHVSSTSLTSLVVDHAALLFLVCNGNERLTKLDVTNALSLQHLDCAGNPLSALDLSRNHQLHTLFCFQTTLFGASLTSLDLTDCRSLQIVKCNDNDLTELRLPLGGRMEFLDCSDNRLSGNTLATILNGFVAQGPPPAEGASSLGVGLYLHGNDNAGAEYENAKTAAVAAGWPVFDEGYIDMALF